MPAALPTANYVEFAIANKTGTSSALYVSLVSKTQAYKFTQYEASGGKTVYVAEVDDSPGSSVASVPLSSLVNEVDGTIGFYVKAFDGSPIAFTSGRLYFADQQNAVPYSDGEPGGIAPDASFDFDFIEFTVDPSTNQFNVDTTQVDQFGIPAYLQVSPKVPDYADGTGILLTQTRANVIARFQKYTQSKSYAPYSGVVTKGEARLLAPQHVIDAAPKDPSTLALRESFNGALTWLFDHYAASSHALYLVGNGEAGPEIFEGKVVDDFPTKDKYGNPATYRVFQFKGTGYCYNGATAALTSVGARGGATYQIFYPHFTDKNPPYWFGGFQGADQKYNLPVTSAGRMVLGASGVFADDVSQKQYYATNGGLPANFDHTMLANLENQLCTMLNRGITPGVSIIPNNHHLRTGSNDANDLISVDLTRLTQGNTGPIQPLFNRGAATLYRASSLVGTGNSVWWNSLTGSILFHGQVIQTFKAVPSNIALPFSISLPEGSPSNYVMNAKFDFGTGGVVSAIEFDWQNAGGLAKDATVQFKFQYGPATPEAHYATLRLFSPYGQAFAFESGDLGPTSQFATGLVGASTPAAPTSGMTMTGISLDDPTYVYRADAGASHITIYSPQGMEPLNTNILTFSRFYPVNGSNAPLGQWNAYAAFFHIGDPANGVPPPTVDGKGYAFAYDDNGGYSSDITVQLPATQPPAPVVVTTLNLTLLPWSS